MDKKQILQKTSKTEVVKDRLLTLYDEIFRHNGYGELKVEMRILRREQKEVILHCGKQYRFVVDYDPEKLRR
ncbi:MAG: hypothetical protein ISR96_02165 [Nitrospira sp.]|nr:hypothetical protein [bacterium]MBL7048322.1 hypothetical protein [Nitrospira sp.]